MANLMQQIKTNAGLGSTSSEELQNLSNASGRAIQPVTPQEAAAVGGSADSAKMAGSSANKLSALRASIRGSMSQTDTERQAGARKQATDAEKQNMQAGKLLGQFTGSLDDRVQHIVNQKLVAASGAPTASGLKVSDSAIDGVAPEQQEAAKALLTKVGNNSATNTDILQLNNLLGRTQVGTELTADEIKANYMTGTQQIGDALATGTAGTVKVSDLDLDSLGLGSKADIANSLGVSPADLDGMTATQMLQQINKANYTQHQQVSTLQAQANSPLLGAAERSQARQALRNASGVGVRAEEGGLRDLQDQVDSAETVKVGNQAMPVEQLLSNDGLKGLVANYLSDPAAADALKASSPELADWIDHNKDALGKLTEGVSQETRDFAAVQQANKDLANIPDTGLSLSNDLAKQIIPGYGTLSDTVQQQPPLVTALHSGALQPEQRATIVGGLEQLYKVDPKLTDEVKNFTADDLHNLGLTTPGGMSNYVAYTQQMKAIGETQGAEAILSQMGVSTSDLPSEIKEIRRMQALGLADYSDSKLLDVLDPSGTGVIGNDGLKERIGGYLGDTKTLGQMLTSGTKATDIKTPTTLAQSLTQPSITNQAAYANMKDALADGDFSVSEAKSLYENVAGGQNNPDTGLMSSMLDKVKAAAAKGLISGEGVAELQNQATRAASDRINLQFQQKGIPNLGYIDIAQNKLTKDGNYIPSDSESEDMKHQRDELQNMNASDPLLAGYKNQRLQQLSRLIATTDANRADKIYKEAAATQATSKAASQATGERESQYWFQKKAPLGAQYESYDDKTGEITYTINGKRKTITQPTNFEQQVDWR